MAPLGALAVGLPGAAEAPADAAAPKKQQSTSSASSAAASGPRRGRDVRRPPGRSVRSLPSRAFMIAPSEARGRHAPPIRVVSILPPSLDNGDGGLDLACVLPEADRPRPNRRVPLRERLPRLRAEPQVR